MSTQNAHRLTVTSRSRHTNGGGWFAPIILAVGTLWSVLAAALSRTAHAAAVSIYLLAAFVFALEAGLAFFGLLHRITVYAPDRRMRKSPDCAVFASLPMPALLLDLSTVRDLLLSLRAAGIKDLATYLMDNPDVVQETQAHLKVLDANDAMLRLVGVQSDWSGSATLARCRPHFEAGFAACMVAFAEERPDFRTNATIDPAAGPAFSVTLALGFAMADSDARIPALVVERREAQRSADADHPRVALALPTADQVALSAFPIAIAHELTQPLMAMSSYAEALNLRLSRDMPDIAKVSELVTGLLASLRDAHQVIARTRALFGTADPDLRPLDLKDLVVDVARLMGHDAASHGAQITVEMTAVDAMVLGDRMLLQQALVNLITNALQAMGTTPLDRRRVDLQLECVERNAVLRVVDGGPGWQSGSFDTSEGPIVTSKPDGMGLGLSICGSILRLHAGAIRLGSGQNGGAQVELAIPLVPEAQGIHSAKAL